MNKDISKSNSESRSLFVLSVWNDCNSKQLVEDNIMLEMHLIPPRLNCSVCQRFSKNKEQIQKFKETGDSRYNYQNELGKPCFQHDMAYRDFKDLPRRTASDKVLRYKLLNIAKCSKCDWYQQGLASITYKSFEKKSSSSGVKSEFISNQELAEEFHQTVVEKIEKRKVHLSFKDNIWGSDLTDMQFLSTINKGSPFFMCYWY